MKPVRIVLLVAALLGAAFIVGFFYIVNDDESAMAAGGALFFGRLSDGKVDEAYDTAAEPLRLGMQRDDIHFLAEDLQRFGRFRKIADVTHLEKGAAGGWLQATALFQKQAVPAKLSFVRVGRTWKVAGIELDFPPGAFPEPDTKALLEQAGKLNERFAADDRGAMYDALTSSTRGRIKPSQFDKDMARLHESCGKMTIGEPAAEPLEAGLATVRSQVLCEKSGHFALRTSWQWQRTRWRLSNLAWNET